MSEIPILTPRLKERWFEITSTAIGLLAVASISWLAALIMAMRDDVTFVKAQLPAISQRIDRVETLTSKLDEEARSRAEKS